MQIEYMTFEEFKKSTLEDSKFEKDFQRYLASESQYRTVTRLYSNFYKNKLTKQQILDWLDRATADVLASNSDMYEVGEYEGYLHINGTVELNREMFLAQYLIKEYDQYMNNLTMKMKSIGYKDRVA